MNRLLMISRPGTSKILNFTNWLLIGNLIPSKKLASLVTYFKLLATVIYGFPVSNLVSADFPAPDFPTIRKL